MGEILERGLLVGFGVALLLTLLPSFILPLNELQHQVDAPEQKEDIKAYFDALDQTIHRIQNGIMLEANISLPFLNNPENSLTVGIITTESRENCLHFRAQVTQNGTSQTYFFQYCYDFQISVLYIDPAGFNTVSVQMSLHVNNEYMITLQFFNREVY